MIPRIMPAKVVTYNSQNYSSTLGSGLALRSHELDTTEKCDQLCTILHVSVQVLANV